MVLQNLSKNLDVEPETVKEFLLDTCRQLGLVQLELELLIELESFNQDEDLMDLYRLYEETQKLQGFIITCTKFGGFFTDCQEIDLDVNERLLGFIRSLHRLVECHMLQSSKPAPKVPPKKAKIESDDEAEVWEFDQSPPKKANNQPIKGRRNSQKVWKPAESGSPEDKARKQKEI